MARLAWQVVLCHGLGAVAANELAESSVWPGMASAKALAGVCQMLSLCCGRSHVGLDATLGHLTLQQLPPSCHRKTYAAL